MAPWKKLYGRREGRLERPTVEKDAASPISSASRRTKSAAEEGQGAATAAVIARGHAQVCGA